MDMQDVTPTNKQSFGSKAFKTAKARNEFRAGLIIPFGCCWRLNGA